MARGFVSLSAVVGGVSRKDLAWTRPITLAADCLVSKLWRTRSPARADRASSPWSAGAPPVRAPARRQGRQVTSTEPIKVLKTAISMDGKGAQAATASLSNASGGR